MKKLTWQDISVQQFIDLNKLSTQKGVDDIELIEKAICIIYDMTERQVEELSVIQFNEYAKICGDVMSDKIEGKPKRIIKTKDNKYKMNYDITSLKHRQYVEIQYFSANGKMIENMHYILASIVQPINKFGIASKNKAEMHEQIANDLLQAKIVDIHSSCVFFCKVYLNLIENMKGSLAWKMMQQGATKEQALQLLNSLINAMAGSIAPQKWQLWNV